MNNDSISGYKKLENTKGITTDWLFEELKKQGYEISKKQIVLDSPIKYAGKYAVEAKLFVGVTAKFNVLVEVL